MLKIKRDSNIKAYIAIAALFLLFLLIYFPTLSVLHGNWSELGQAYAHGYVVLGLTVYLLYISKEKIFNLNQRVTGKYFLINLVAILLCSIVWFLASSVQVQVVQLCAVILMVWLWVAVVFGRAASIYALLPMGLLLMAMPLWEGLVSYLQAMTIFSTQAFLSWIGITAFINGSLIYLVDGAIEVAEECSGLKYLLAGVSLAIVYAELNYNTIQRKIVIVLLASVTAILANWIRVIFLVLIADASAMQSSMLHDHDNLGWVVFGLCFAMFLIITGRINSGHKVDEEISHVQVLNGDAVGLIGNYYIRAGAATLMVVLLPVFSWIITEEAGTNLLSHQFQHNLAEKINKPEWAPAYTGFDEVNTWRLRNSGQEIDVTIMSYRDQRQGKELIYYSNKINSSEYKLTNISSLEISKDLSINRSILNDKSKAILVGWFYKVGSRESNDSNIAKLLQIPSIVEGVPVASLVAISLECVSINCKNEVDLILSREWLEGIVNAITVHRHVDNTL